MAEPQRNSRTPTTSGPEDEALLEQFLLGDEGAYRVLYDRYSSGVLTYLHKILVDYPEVADDLWQETFIKLYGERKKYRAGIESGEYNQIKNFKGWLFRVAHNLAISHLRSRRQTVSLSDGEEDGARWDERLMVPIEESFASQFGSEDAMADETLHAKLRQCIELLPQSLREVYLLREVNEMEYEDVATTVGCTQEAARMRVSRARRALRKALERYLQKNR